ncbi:MAG: hypothetical protein SF172_03715 [Burkholderiales bacterium]|nr:hypothetical protein [Burkholderiales bacterium]
MPPLLGPQEKAELEGLMLECLRAHYHANGGTGLLTPGVSLVVRSSGVAIEPKAADNCLAQVEVRQLFTAVCYLASEVGEVALPEDALSSLATEATSATAAQINKLG